MTSSLLKSSRLKSSLLGRVGGALAVVVVLGGCDNAGGDADGGCVGAITFDNTVYSVVETDGDEVGFGDEIGTGTTRMCDDGGDTDAETDLEDHIVYEVDGIPTEVAVAVDNFDGGEGMAVFVSDSEWEHRQPTLDELVEMYGAPPGR